MDWPLCVSSQAAGLDLEAEMEGEMVEVWGVPFFLSVNLPWLHLNGELRIGSTPLHHQNLLAAARLWFQHLRFLVWSLR